MESDKHSPSSRRPTGIEGFDQILGGGIPSDSTILLAGDSGTGKTILAMQWLAAGYQQFNEPGVYLSFTEPLNKAIRNVEKFSFAQDFKMAWDKIVFEDVRTMMGNLGIQDKELTVEDVNNLIGAIGDLISEGGARRVVIDSITAIGYHLHDPALIRRFIFHLDALLASTNVNIMMTSEVKDGVGYSIFGVEEFISDGIIKLSRSRVNKELVRTMEVVKMRGMDYDSHPVTYRITEDGYKFFPLQRTRLAYQSLDRRVTTGLPVLDKMTKGGYIEGSSILVTGSSGAGKSILALQFLVSNLSQGKNALLVSLEESKSQVARNAQSFGWDLGRYEKDGVLHYYFSYPEQRHIEEQSPMEHVFF